MNINCISLVNSNYTSFKSKTSSNNNLATPKEKKSKKAFVVAAAALAATGIAAVMILKNKKYPTLQQNIIPVERPHGWRLQSDEAKRLKAMFDLDVLSENEKMFRLRTGPGGVALKIADLKDAFGSEVEYIRQKSKDIFFN